MKKWFWVVVAGMALSFNAAWAQSMSPWRGVASVGVSVGGDKLADVSYVNSSSTDTLSAGGGAYLNVGVSYQFTPEWALQATVGLHSDGIEASNGSVDFDRYPVEVMGLYALNHRWNLGLGLRASGAKFKSQGDAAFLGQHKFDNSMGPVLELQYLLDVSQAYRVGIAGRYVVQKFKSSSWGGSVKGDHAGVGLFVNF